MMPFSANALFHRYCRTTLRLLVLLVGLAPVASGSEIPDFFSYGFALGDDQEISVSEYLGAERLTLSEVQQLAAASSGYEDFLARLRQREPELFANYVLVHESGSLQAASLLRPRVIAFTRGLFLAFAEPLASAERRVEILAFAADRWQFVTHELVFAAEVGPPEQEANPRRCRVCHGADPKPLWNSYDFWPGAYGSHIGRLGTDAEQAAYDDFSSQPATGIYRFLAPMTIQRGRVVAIESLSQHITTLAMIRLAGALKRRGPQPLFPSLLAALSRCGAPPEWGQGGDTEAFRHYFPEGYEAFSQGLDQAMAASVVEHQRYKEYLRRRYQARFPGAVTTFPIDLYRLQQEAYVMGAAAYVLRAMGVDLRQFVLSQGQNPYFMGVPGNYSYDLTTVLSLADPDFYQANPPRLRQGRLNWLVFDCASLASASKAKLRGQGPPPPPPASQPPDPVPTTWGRCIGCHVLQTTQSGAPAIPFDRTAALAAWLNQDGGRPYDQVVARVRRQGSGRMPPDRPLAADELADFLAVLKEIKSGAGPKHAGQPQ